MDDLRETRDRVSPNEARVLRPLAAILLLWLLSGGVASAQVQTCHPAIDKGLPQYIVGYGSLMETASKQRTAPNTGENLPVMATGYERAWNTRGSTVGFSTTYLGVRPRAEASMAAAIYRVFDAGDIAATDEREAFYCRERVPPAQLRMLDGSAAPEKGEIWIYVNKPENVHPPSERFPIVQSYVDIFLSGCFQLKEKVVGQNVDFTEACISTTEGWSERWVNDRLMPRRPFIYQPNASRIDALLARMLPKQFTAITIE